MLEATIPGMHEYNSRMGRYALKRRSCACQQLPVWHTRRTCGLARAAAKTPVDVRAHVRVGWWQRPLDERAHEHDAASRAVVLVLEREIRRARLETEAAMHACVDARTHSGERRARQRASGSGASGSAPLPSTPQFPMCAGS